MPNQPELFYLDANGERIAVFEWGRKVRGLKPTVLLIHATGFHARCWDQVISLLGERHIIAIDQRGHGRSSGSDYDSWKEFGRDVSAVLDQLQLDNIVAVGHSMGGYVAVSAAAAVAQSQPTLFRNLILIDPVIVDPARYQDPTPSPEQKAQSIANMGRRRNKFDSAQQMIDRFASREPYALFTPQALRDYCTHGLLPAPEGDGLMLACDPFFEASIYITVSSDRHILDDVTTVTVPVLVVRAKIPDDPSQRQSFSFSPTWPELASHFSNAVDKHLPGHSHFIPMEDPILVAELIKNNS
jgi:pimeloyl-ACP methyl ester carboxylesterase